MRGRDVSRKEGKREKRRGRYIYIYARGIAKQGRNYPRGKTTVGAWALALNYNQEDGASLPCPPTIWTLCFTPSFVLPQGTRYVRLQNLLLA